MASTSRGGYMVWVQTRRSCTRRKQKQNTYSMRPRSGTLHAPIRIENEQSSRENHPSAQIDNNYGNLTHYGGTLNGRRNALLPQEAVHSRQLAVRTRTCLTAMRWYAQAMGSEQNSDRAHIPTRLISARDGTCCGSEQAPVAAG